MARQHTIDEAVIRQRVEQWAEAIRAMDLDGVISIYAADVVSFDLDGVLQYVGARAKSEAWENVFRMYRRPLGYEVRDLALTVGDDVAFGHSLNRISGTLKGGNRSGFWLRWTTCYRKIDGRWLVAHEQLSVPVDPKSGRASLDLQP
jgi:uncharacterized protein (TIGR02246 family)